MTGRGIREGRAIRERPVILGRPDGLGRPVFIAAFAGSSVLATSNVWSADALRGFMSVLVVSSGFERVRVVFSRSSETTGIGEAVIEGN